MDRRRQHHPRPRHQESCGYLEVRTLANLAFRETDEQLQIFAEERGLRLTRYADDITFSGVGEVEPSLEQEVRNILEPHGWTIAERKTRTIKLPHRYPKVLGLLVDGDTPRLPKSYRNRLRLMRHLLEVGDLSQRDHARFRGHIAYADSIE